MDTIKADFESTSNEITATFLEATSDINASFEVSVEYEAQPYYEVSNDKGTTIIIGS